MNVNIELEVLEEEGGGERSDSWPSVVERHRARGGLERWARVSADHSSASAPQGVLINSVCGRKRNSSR